MIQLWHVDGDSQDERVRRAAQRLAGMISVITSRDANLITVYVKSRSASLSVAICSRIIAAVNEYNLTKRHGRASAERVFTETRLADVKLALRAAEDSMRAFSERNRAPVLSARLRLQAQRLQRDVDIQQALFLSLSQAVEQAKIDEVRDTPVVTVVERPELTVTRDTQPLLVALVLSVLVTGSVVAWTMIRPQL